MTDEQKKFLHLVIIYQKSYDVIEKELGIERNVFSKWWDMLRIEREELSSIRKIWKTKFKSAKLNDFDSFYAFKDWFETTKRACYYCEITKIELNELWTKYPTLTKRKRGRNFEIERLQPNLDYDVIDNLVYSCYWCNNAKTDTFTAAEFKIIGKQFNRIWKKRLSCLE